MVGAQIKEGGETSVKEKRMFQQDKITGKSTRK
jgi:hypothetical protein